MVNERTVRSWERGETQPLGFRRPHLATLFGIHYHRLFIPEEIVLRLHGTEQRLLLLAKRIVRGGNALWVPYNSETRRAVVGLGMLWLTQAAPTRPEYWRLTGSGEDVLALLKGENGQ